MGSRRLGPLCLGILALSGALAGLVPALFRKEPPAVVAGGAPPSRAVLLGRVEPVGGEVDVSALMTGVIESLHVIDGDEIEAGAVIARLDARREKAQVDLAASRLELAKARLARVVTGAGEEEKAALLARRKSAEADLAFSRLELERARKLRESGSEREEAVDRATLRVTALEEQVQSLGKEHEALKRGPLPQEVDVAKAEVAAAESELKLAETVLDYSIVRAPFKGTVLEVHKHAGDLVAIELGTSVLRFADVTRLRVRVEVPEGEATNVEPGQTGVFAPLGIPGREGKLVLKRVIPSFGPKRLFEPDTSLRVDVRTIQALCEIEQPFEGMFSGQRVNVRLAGAR